MTNHPLPGELIESIKDKIRDCRLFCLEPNYSIILQPIYDKGRDDTLSKVCDWISDNLEDPRLLDDVYVVVDGEGDDLSVAINTDQIVDDLYETFYPQEDN